MPAHALARRTEDAERALSTTGGEPSRDGALLTERLERRYHDRITGSFMLPGRAGRYAPIPDDVPAALVAALKARGIAQLYSHQAEAWDAAQRGEHVAIVTPTASGKSLCYTLPVVAAAMTAQAKALYLFPTKALAQDQVAELLELNRAGELGVKAFTFDGDTPGDARQAIRLHGDIVVSNPDMLHQAILPHHTKWAQFFENLRYVVIDEIHTYRGVFGSHVTNVLRRLKRICAFYGVNPQFILCSATIGNPRAHAEALIEQRVHAITESGAPSGDKHVLLWNPPVVNADLGLRASARSQSNRIARIAIKSGLKTLVFAQTRLMVEVLTKYLKDIFDHDPRKPPRIRAYRGGYLPTERREAERAMRAGSIDGIVSTSALELGVDIGALDVVVLNGYPGSVAATWQRFGRAGRRQQPSLGVLVASSQPLDQYVVRHPDFFADASPEHARIAPDQPLILFDHIRCAAFELTFVAGEAFGPVDPAVFLEALAESEVVHQEGDRWEWIADSYPANAVSLRSVADGNFVVVDKTDGKQQIIAEVDYSAAALTLYEGAIHMVQSTPYQVEKLDWEGRKAYVTRTHVDYYTDSIDFTKLKVLDRFDGGAAGRGDSHHGEVHVVRRVAGYKKIRYYTHENIGYGPVTLPDQELHTTAVWWQLPQATLLKAFAAKQDALDGFLGAAYALHVVATVAVMADARDLQKAVGDGDGAWFAMADAKGRGQLRGGDTGEPVGVELQQFVPTVYLYDNFPGGVGLSEPLWQRQAELVQRARELVQRCDCVAGCPACVGPVLAAQEDSATTPKALALQVLRLLLDGGAELDEETTAIDSELDALPEWSA
ncbi:Distinct helicase family with a unique C-terminal domain including a metal-binding cysteine cluster [Xanthomonas translucens pv. poae]|uniref:Distinct helicase family with a unique C-terminal domain including a metal-binding cysteine cluster n=1 Tax=Xanthomonas graminis pv. poae TaxID=227946 RepID=A0A0K3AAX3_9XANT|nr:DEAD/DEAH box helicase [Xanthomonas translucens]UKE62169.1 DEAD/DEAH box helicase [Xanthomonas translucens pv. poae]CTP92640.1 Distinct helicase family with a unique C-terminal domain including a metal-binding cysteine cluster [Xanthomonas translucens pv. poae]